MESHSPHDSDPDVLARERRLRLEAEARCEALRESERRYQDLVDRLPAALYTCDADGRIQTFNAAAVALWGRIPVVGRERWCGSHRIFRPDGSALPVAECPMAVTLRERRPVVGEEIVIERPDGERRVVLPHPQPIFSPSGELVGAVNMLVDVSDLKRTRRALASTRDVLADQVHTLTRLHSLSMFLGSGFDLGIGLQAVVDTFAELHGADHGLLSLYDEASGLLFPAASTGFAPETLLLLGEMDPGLPANVCGRAFTSGQRAVVQDIDADLEFAAARPIAWMAGFRAVHSVPILRRSGGTIGVLSAFFAGCHLPTDAERQIADICALHAADAVESALSRRALEESEERFRHMADHAPVLIWVMGIGGCEFANQEFLRFVGATEDEIRGKGWTRFLHPADGSLLADCLSAPERTPFAAQTRLVRKDGCYRWVRWAGTPRFADDGTFLGYVACAVDITDMKESEAALRQADRRKDEFLATLGHQLRNSLAPIRTAQHLLRLPASSPDAERVHEILGRQVDHLVRLVDDLTAAASAGPGKGPEFRVSLPIAPTAAPDRPATGAPARGGAPISGRRVLVVDDNQDAADSLGMMLEALGAEVTVLYDGPGAVKHVEDHRPEIVLLDIGMPGMSGYDVAREIRRRSPDRGHVILIALTGWGQEEDRRRSAEAGFDYHLVKPLQFETLQSVLASLMKRQRTNVRQA